MGCLEYKITIPRRQAIYAGWKETDGAIESIDIRCFVWPMPTKDGMFVIEREDGICQKVNPHELRFLDTKKLFEQNNWSEE